MAQVYTSLGELDSAIHYYTEAMAMDPLYSEYYNEKGEPVSRTGEARRGGRGLPARHRDQLSLSGSLDESRSGVPPAGTFPGSRPAYSHGVDLDPTQPLSFVGRVQSYEAFGQGTLALADYSSSLELKPDQPLVLGNRAILYYEAGRLAESLRTSRCRSRARA